MRGKVEFRCIRSALRKAHERSVAPDRKSSLRRTYPKPDLPSAPTIRQIKASAQTRSRVRLGDDCPSRPCGSRRGRQRHMRRTVLRKRPSGIDIYRCALTKALPRSGKVYALPSGIIKRWTFETFQHGGKIRFGAPKPSPAFAQVNTPIINVEKPFVLSDLKPTRRPRR